MGRRRRCLRLLEACLEPAPRTEEPDAEGDRADPQGLRGLARCQVLPGDEEERLAVELREPAQSALQGRIELDGRLVDVLPVGRRCGGRWRRAPRLREDEVARRSVEPRQGVVGGTSSSRRQAMVIASAAIPSGSLLPRLRA